MPLKSLKEVLNLKLNCIPSKMLKEFAKNLGIDNKISTEDIIKRILNGDINEDRVDAFIKQKYLEKINQRRKLISDTDLVCELKKVEDFSWGIVQGQLDQKIQVEYVRKFYRYEDLINNVNRKLHNDITNYVICTWFNHWTTVLIEEHISSHPRVIPTIKNIKGTDIFFDGQPFDLKITYIPRGYDPNDAINDPKRLAIWMYENQGAQRFGSDNRIFIILLDTGNPNRSWELKRDFTLVFREIDKFFHNEKVSRNDEIIFSFRKRTYIAITKLLIITR